MLITVSCDEDVEEVGEDDVEEFVDKPGTTNGTYRVYRPIRTFPKE